jgi:NitT/TauT family transport system substrate-binding protein
MRKVNRWLTAAVVAVGLAALASPVLAADKIRVAFGDVPSVESLGMLIAFERARQRGVDIELISLKEEDLAAQAVVSGQADVGIGTPYALLQKVDAPIRMFFQMSALRFYPIVNSEFYKEWKDLDGQDFAVHSRGSGTEAIMRLMAQKHDIDLNISFVPGSEVRAGAMLQGNIKATIVDSANKRLLMEKGGPDKFTVLPMEGVNATDEALYASQEFLTANAESIDILVEELIKVAREIDADPAAAAKLRTELGLLAELPADLEGEIDPYFSEAAEVDLFSMNGGSPEGVADDFAFYALAGQLEGDPATLKVEDFWDFGARDRALAKLGTE